jgi:hypothetical protein
VNEDVQRGRLDSVDDVACGCGVATGVAVPRAADDPEIGLRLGETCPELLGKVGIGGVEPSSNNVKVILGRNLRRGEGPAPGSVAPREDASLGLAHLEGSVETGLNRFPRRGGGLDTVAEDDDDLPSRRPVDRKGGLRVLLLLRLRRFGSAGRRGVAVDHLRDGSRGEIGAGLLQDSSGLGLGQIGGFACNDDKRSLFLGLGLPGPRASWKSSADGCSLERNCRCS